MKMRTLHPDFFTDSTLALLSYEARLLYAGLWCHSDDYGRGRWLPKRIEGEIFPHDDVDIEVLLESLVDAGLIVQYTHPGKSGQDRFYFIPNWGRYQSPKYRAKTSIPEPPDESPGQTDPGQLGTNPGEIAPDTGKDAQEFAPGEGEGEGEEVTTSPNPSMLPAERWSRHWCELMGITPTRSVLKFMIPKAQEYIAEAGEPTDGLLKRAKAAGIRTPGGWGFISNPQKETVPDWLEDHWKGNYDE